MITERFVNSCFRLLLNKKINVKKTKVLYRDVRDMIQEWTEKESVEIPLSFKPRVDLLFKLCDMLLKDRTIETAIDSILEGQYKSQADFLESVINEEIDESDMQDTIRQIRLRKKVHAIFKNYDDLSHIVEEIKDGSFETLDDLADNYEEIIQKLYTNMMDSKRSVTLEAAASLDLVSDDYEHVIDMIRKKYESKNTTPTGFKIFDDVVMNGGYEPSRLYIYGGGSGAGKSTIMNDSIIYSATQEHGLMEGEIRKEGEINRVYIYITLENSIEESLMRTYQPLFNKTKNQFLSDIAKGVDIKKMVVDALKKTGSTIIMKYFPGKTISVMDLRGIVDDAISVYGKGKIAGLYVDYIDILKSDTRHDMYRLELSDITLSLKSLAVEYNIPVITASQLGRGVYRIKDAAELGVDMMSESIKKVEHADFVMLLARDQTSENKIFGKVGKNRSGQSNIALEFPVDFSRFKFENGKIAANKKKADSCSTDMPFHGFDSI